MSNSLEADFASLYSSLRAGLSGDGQVILDRLILAEPKRFGARGFTDLGNKVVKTFAKVTEIELASERRDLSRALIAGLAQHMIDRTMAAGVTQSMLEHAKDWQERLLGFLGDKAPDDYCFPSDLFIKDYRYTTALSVPCGAQVIDLDNSVGFKTAGRLALQRPKKAIYALRQRWFRPHTESRYLDEFNEAGWERFYREIAALFALHPQIRGLVAKSWFYDPELSAISPHLAYLRETPLKEGAIATLKRT